MGQPLHLENFRNRPLTIVIYWKQRTGFDSLQNGHAALVIDSAVFSMMNDEYYVSWLGSDQGNAFRNRSIKGTFAGDSQDWGGEAVGDGTYHLPTRWVALSGLQVGNMKAAWDQMRTKQRAHWKLFDKNCATAVARILKAGGGDDFATGHKQQLVWWPTDLLKYARSMGTNVFQTS